MMVIRKGVIGQFEDNVERMTGDENILLALAPV
jgi:hypothetical protein